MDYEIKYSKMLEDAKLLAIERHKGQKRWNGDDYYTTHLVTVSQNASKRFMDNAEYFKNGKSDIYKNLILNNIVTGYQHAIVGILHDIVEDTTTKIDEIYDKFGETIGDAVHAMTHFEGEEYDVYIKRLCSNDIARNVKLADLQHNLETVSGNKRKLYQMAYEYIDLVNSYENG